MRLPRRSKAASGTIRMSGSTSGASSFGSRMPQTPSLSAWPNVYDRMISGFPPPATTRSASGAPGGPSRPPRGRGGSSGGRKPAHQGQRIDLGLERREAGDDHAGRNRDGERPRRNRFGG